MPGQPLKEFKIFLTHAYFLHIDGTDEVSRSNIAARMATLLPTIAGHTKPKQTCNSLVILALSSQLTKGQQKTAAQAAANLIDNYYKGVLLPKLSYELSDIQFRQQTEDYLDGLTLYFKALLAASGTALFVDLNFVRILVAVEKAVTVRLPEYERLVKAFAKFTVSRVGQAVALSFDSFESSEVGDGDVQGSTGDEVTSEIDLTD